MKIGVFDSLGKRGSAKWLGVLLTFIVIAGLFAIGPAQAFVLGITPNKNVVSQGEDLELKGNVDFDSVDKLLPISSVKIDLFPLNAYNGTGDLTCALTVKGARLFRCPGFGLVELNLPDPLLGEGNRTGTYNSKVFNFGYGYGVVDDVDYTLRLFTDKYSPGKYKARFTIVMAHNNGVPSHSFSSDFVEFEINP